MNFLLLVALLSLCAISRVFAFNNSVAITYDSDEASRSLWLSIAAYCGKDQYSTHVFKGPTTGFVLTYTISDIATDTEGYIGYLPSAKTIYVVFRGTQDTRNWLSNLDVVKTSYTTYTECNCQVHKGFYAAEQKVLSGILSHVKLLISAHPGYSLKVTGHSLGAALAQLTSMDLLKAGYTNTVYNFGQPRVGDATYAKFAAAKVPTIRVTHNKDTVPHVPYTEMGFYHMCTEEFENSSGSVKTCTASCEDPSCANQYPFSQTNVDDHLTYLGVKVSCAAVSTA